MIERRILLAALATAAAAPAFAQTSNSQMSKDQPSGSTAATRSGQQAELGEAEKRHIMNTMAAGGMSLLASRAALKKVRDDDVKEFAQFEVAEQETIADVLMAMMDPSKASGKINPPSDSEVRQQVSKDDQAMLEKMEGMNGEAFEKAYIRAQIDGHQKLLRIQEDYLASGKDPAHLGIAKLARGQIKEHLTLLADLSEDGKATTGQSKSSK
jgi:predicted outer membrane protein